MAIMNEALFAVVIFVLLKKMFQWKTEYEQDPSVESLYAATVVCWVQVVLAAVIH